MGFEKYSLVVVAVCNVGIAAAISKSWGKSGKTVLSFSHAFPSASLCAVHVRQFEGASPSSNLMEVKD
jgi:hypothetical protein